MDFLDPVRDIIHGFMTTQLFVSVHVLLIVVHVILGAVAYMTFFERKVSAYIQDRIGPNRVGFDFGLPFLAFLKGALGLGQPLADGIKFLLKEDYMPRSADRFLFTLAPATVVIPAILGFAILPWGGYFTMPPIGDVPIIGGIGEWLFGPIGGERVVVAGLNANVGVVYLLAVASLGVYGVVLGGWASNNKYSFLGGLRATAQMVSYEIPLGLSLMAVLLVTGTIMPMGIIAYQQENGWMLFAQPIAAVLFFVAILAEANRAPFDNAEAEQELVGGYNTEYASMRYALFFLAEYMHMVTSCAFFALLFLGGFHIPGVPLLGVEDTGLLAVLAKFAVFLTKAIVLVVFMMFIRWTLPRLRYDQVMFLGWQSMIPLSLIVVVGTAVMVFYGMTSWVQLLIANAGLAFLVVLIQPLLPKQEVNKKLPLYGSRYSPVLGERVQTAAPTGLASEDRPEVASV
ncbi:MAG: complex I subunit 1 family protein [Planctomycetota bacterium]